MFKDLIPKFLIGLLVYPLVIIQPESMISQSRKVLADRFRHNSISGQSISLTDKQISVIKSGAMVFRVNRNYHYYIISNHQVIQAVAIIDTHTLRSRRQSLLVTIDSQGRILNLDILDFHEPARFKAPKRWLDLFTNQTVSNFLVPGKDLPAISGATITSQKTSNAIRKSLHLFKILKKIHEIPESKS